MEQQRVALVTGSATGIGRAVAWRFAERGFAITVNYSRSKDEAEETAEGVRSRGGRVIVVKADVADDTAVRAMVERTIEMFGGLDVLVNNAATTYFVPHTDLDGLTAPGLGRHPQREPQGHLLRLPGGDAAPEGSQWQHCEHRLGGGRGGLGELGRLRGEQGCGHHIDEEPGQGVRAEVRVNAVAPGRSRPAGWPTIRTWSNRP